MSNFAYNFQNNITDLINVLLTPYMGEEENMLMSVHQFDDREERRFYKDGDETNEVCRVVYTEKSILFYEKSNNNTTS